MDTYNILPVNKPTNFKHTCDHLAREWYDSLTFPLAWNNLQQRFSRYFSTQGRSIKHLHDKWRNFSFTSGQDDIEAYIRDVKEAAHHARSFCSQLGGGCFCVFCCFFCNCARGFYCSDYALNVLRLLGNVVRVYPRIVQGLTFLSA